MSQGQVKEKELEPTQEVVEPVKSESVTEEENTVPVEVQTEGSGSGGGGEEGKGLTQYVLLLVHKEPVKMEGVEGEHLVQVLAQLDEEDEAYPEIVKFQEDHKVELIPVHPAQERYSCVNFGSLRELTGAKYIAAKKVQSLSKCWKHKDRKYWIILERVHLSEEQLEMLDGISLNPTLEQEPAPIHPFELLTLTKIFSHLEIEFVNVQAEAMDREKANALGPEGLYPVPEEGIPFTISGVLKEPNAQRHAISLLLEGGEDGSFAGSSDVERLLAEVSDAIIHLSNRVNRQEEHIRAQNQYIMELQIALQEEVEGRLIHTPSDKDIMLVAQSKRSGKEPLN